MVVPVKNQAFQPVVSSYLKGKRKLGRLQEDMISPLQHKHLVPFGPPAQLIAPVDMQCSCLNSFYSKQGPHTEASGFPRSPLGTC